jgi:hypothetical protein
VFIQVPQKDAPRNTESTVPALMASLRPSIVNHAGNVPKSPCDGISTPVDCLRDLVDRVEWFAYRVRICHYFPSVAPIWACLFDDSGCGDASMGSAAEAAVDIVGVAARLKSCPDTNSGELRSAPRTGASGARWVSTEYAIVGWYVSVGGFVGVRAYLGSSEIVCLAPVAASAEESIQRCNAVSAVQRLFASSITT